MRAVIRPAAPGDLQALSALYPAAFPDEDLVPLLRGLIGLGRQVTGLAATEAATVIGHVAVTPGRVAGAPGGVALLGPLAVAPDCQGRGIGSSLVRTAIAAARRRGAVRMLVLGDSGYYGRFGFRPERRVRPPYPLPREWQGAWQGLALRSVAPAPWGPIALPRIWQRRALWAP